MNNEQINDIKQYIIVKSGNEKYGIDIKQVLNIDRLNKITRVPKSPDFIKGVINLRGEIIPVMSLRQKLGLESDEYTNDTRIIIVKTSGYIIGIIVDEVKEVLQLDMKSVEEVQGFSNKINSNYITGVGKISNDIIILLKVDGFINQQD